MTSPADPDAPAALLALAVPAAAEVAARLEASLDGPPVAMTSKSTPTDLVTELDRWAESRLREVLLGARPDDGFEGEEGEPVRGTSGVTWCVDPIDGTVNFVHGLPGFCVSIAALVDDRAVAGVVHSPLHRDVFTATVGGGAARNGRPIRCSAPAALDRSVIGTGFGYDPVRRTRQAEVVARAIGSIADIRRAGAAAMDLCSVGAGRLDGYWEVGLNRWDLAAGALIATEAGARVEGLDGAPPDQRLVVAAPPEIFDALAALVVTAGATDL